MAFKITDTCISCGTCTAACPVDAIAMGDEHYEINADLCLSCGTCAGACPMGSIEED